jgi:hypothetical protein
MQVQPGHAFIMSLGAAGGVADAQWAHVGIRAYTGGLVDVADLPPQSRPDGSMFPGAAQRILRLQVNAGYTPLSFKSLIFLTRNLPDLLL